jgi:uncharacterized protein YecE (DUF72 family)
MSTVLIGTSGYSYTEWVGPFYPEGTPQGEYLSYYAQHFNTVELNFSYYRMPEATQLAMMHQSAPTLRFSIKAHRSMTHQRETGSWRAESARFYRALEPLVKEGALDAVLLQFPASFHYEIDNRRYLDALLKNLNGLPLAVEFRSSRWYNNRTLDALRERDVAFACLDLPAVEGNPPMMDVITSNLAYLRLHGRNRETWWGSDAASRYDYLYSEAELSSIAERLAALSQQAGRTLVYFNNHRGGQAVANARRLVQLWEARNG